MIFDKDPLWIQFPRWIEESGLPEQLCREYGCEGWAVFRKLVEIDCERNMTPDWFAFSLSDVARWAGLSIAKVEPALYHLEQGEWIDRRNIGLEIEEAVIISPLEVPLPEEEIRKRLTGSKAKGGRFLFRYQENIREMEKVEKVIYLYQMLFGPKFTAKVVQDLEEIANLHDMGVIHSIFSEAFQRKIKSFSWIKSHLGMCVAGSKEDMLS